MTGRRLTLQLTPLLDLLLIVIFAQYLDVGERGRVVSAENERLRQETADLRVQQRMSLARTADLEAAATNASERADRERQRSEALTAAAAAAFGTAEASFRDALRDAADGTLSPQERRTASERLQSLMSGEPQTVVRHLLENAEMRNRVDIWRLHLRPDGRLSVRAGEDAEAFRADSETVGTGAFVEQLRRFVDRVPDGKSLVLLTLTYDERVYLSTLEPLRAELRDSVSSLEKNSRSRFHFADLGYQAEPAAGATPAP